MKVEIAYVGKKNETRNIIIEINREIVWIRINCD